MASLIVHGDLGANEAAPIRQRLYVRPIMRPDNYAGRREQAPEDLSWVDLIHPSRAPCRRGRQEFTTRCCPQCGSSICRLVIRANHLHPLDEPPSGITGLDGVALSRFYLS